MFLFLDIFKGTKKLKANELDNYIGKINLIDIRETHEYKGGHVPTAKNIPMNKLIQNAEKLLKNDKEYHIICQSGGRSSRACGILRKKGFDVVNISGGTMSYKGKLKK